MTLGFQKLFNISLRITVAIASALSLAACDPVTWYYNETLRVSEVTNQHVITQQDTKLKVRIFRFAKQLVAEIEFEIIPKERVSLTKTDIQLLSDSKPLHALGFVDNLNEASVKKYDVGDLKDSVPFATGKKVAVVFADSKNKVLELQVFGLNYRFERAN